MVQKKSVLILITSIFIISFVSNIPGYSTTTGSNLSYKADTIKINAVSHNIVNLTSKYQLIVHQDEPVRTGVDGIIMLMLYKYSDDGVNKTPVIGAENNLTASIIKESAVLSVNTLTASTSTPGTYTIPFNPSKAGLYTLHLNGTLGTSNISKDIELENVSSVSDNLMIYLVIPLGLISVGAIGGIIFLKYRKRKNSD